MIAVRLPDGRTINVETDDPQAASKAAKAFLARETAGAAAEKRSQSTPGWMRAALQGPTLGFADEIDAGIAAAQTGLVNLGRRVTGKPSVGYGMGDAYQAVMASEAKARDDYARRHPAAALAYPIATGAAVAPGAGVAANYVGSANSLLQASLRSGVVGAGYGALAGAGSAPDGLASRAKGAAVGGALGGAIGAATPVAVRAATDVTRRFMPVDEQAAMREAEAALAEAGVNVRAVSRATMDRIRMQVRQGRDAREAALGVMANTEFPVPVPTTRGQRTGDPGQQLSENLMLRGARGSAASRQMRGLAAEQQDALRGNVEAMGGQIAGGRLPQRGQGGEAVSARLNSLYDDAERGVDQAYDAARNAASDARLPDGESFTLAGRLREAVRPYATERTAAGVFDEINALGQGRNIPMQDIQAARTRLVSLQGSSDGPVRNAASRAKAALDAYVDEVVERGIIAGDEANLWRAAIASRRAMGRTFEAGDLVAKLTARNVDGSTKIDPNSAANEILSRSDMGFVGRKNLYRDIGKLRTMLGPQSPEWNALRGEVFGRVASQAEGAVEFGARQFSGVKFQKAWQDFLRKDAQLARVLFSDAERSQISNFATLAARVTSPVKGGDNPSNTAVTAMRLLGNLRFLRGLPLVKEMSAEIETQINLGVARRATSGAYGAAPRPQSPNQPLNALLRHGGGVAGQAGGQSANALLKPGQE